jgi:hypothetical protein
VDLVRMLEALVRMLLLMHLQAEAVAEVLVLVVQHQADLVVLVVRVLI